MRRLMDLDDCDYGAEVMAAAHDLGLTDRADSQLLGSAIGAAFTAKNFPNLGFNADGHEDAELISALAALLVAKADWNMVEAQLQANTDGA